MENVTKHILLFLLIIRSNTVKSGCSLMTTVEQEPCQGVLSCIGDLNMASGLVLNWKCRKIAEYAEYDRYGNYQFHRARVSDKYTLSVYAENIQDSSSFNAFMQMQILSDHISSITVTNGTISEIPSEFNNLSIAKKLDVSNNLIQSIHLQEFSRTNLEVLNVSFNRISDLNIASPTGQTVENQVTTIDLSNNLIEAIPNNCFRSFPQLQHLNLSHNLIENIDILTFEGLANMNTLYISGNKITNIGQSFARFVHIKELLLDQNYITSIESNNFSKMTNLEILDLSCNHIRSVDDSAFGDLLALMKLNISGNKLHKISKPWFQHNNNLTLLDVSNNTISQIEQGVFEGKSITEFNIQNNNLTGSLEKGIFRGINVEELDVSGAYITELGPDLFGDSNTNLKFLNISRNFIHKIHNTTFNKLKLVRTLDLSHNKLEDIQFYLTYLKNLSTFLVNDNSISKISRNVFKNLAALKTIQLSNNFIMDIEVLSFEGLSEVESLMLDNNPLPTAIGPQTFTGLISCIKLDLSYAKVTTVHNNAFNGMQSLTTFNMSYGNLRVLEYEAFNGTSFIENLDLSHNQLELFLVNNTNIKIVKTVDLSYNILQHITDKTFSGLDNLMILCLHHNKIVSIENAAFSTLRSLMSLILSNNKEMMFNSSIFANLTSLELLYLDHVSTLFHLENAVNTSVKGLDISACGITDIYLVLMYELRTMERLKLSSNKIRSIDKFSFDKLQQLTWIDLSNNLISSIQPSSFSHSLNVRFLNLSNNFISSLQFGVFDGLASLRDLDLSNNTLHSLRANIFHNAPHVQVLYLDDNLIDDINFIEFHAVSISTVSIGGNIMPCNYLTELKKYALSEFTVTAKVRKYDSENVNGITCKSTTKLEKVSPVHVNDTVLTAALLSTVEEFKLTIERILSRNQSKVDVDTTAFNNISLSIKQFQDIFNRSERTRNDLVGNLMSSSNSSNFYLKNILAMLKEPGFARDLNSSQMNTAINDDDIEEKVNKLFKLQKETLKYEFTSVFNDWRSRNVAGEKNHPEPITTPDARSGDIKTALYFIAACLVVLIFVMVLIFYVKFRNQRVHDILYSSRQPLSSSIEMN